MKKLLACLSLLLIPSLSWGFPAAIQAVIGSSAAAVTPVALDNHAARAQNGAGTIATDSFSYTNTGDFMLVCVNDALGSGGLTHLLTIKYATIDLTLVDSVDNGANGNKISLYKLDAPAAGANTFETTWNTAVTLPYWTYHVSTWSNVNATTPLGTVAKNGGTGTSDTRSITVSNNGVGVDCLGWRDDPGAVTAPTQIDKNNDGGPVTYTGTYYTTSTGSVSLNDSWANSVIYGHIGVPIAPQ